ncbi:TPA: ABC transporter transmembrane domain-containing protein [Vibrio vulnificus]|uniref:peptidase domain-containing ABC transporter n=1 Tax=Vibrio vulnificus TaxID=672 RepID=UPI001A1D64DB|nr:ABC transporter transmembrane domain-containing protein [Vibrio vulnificus]MCA4015391.1 ATP-binding cassette domain-containing protein [Vibrio vulnificus]HAS6144898.1 ATP-binding cassette domain-containing protein [Vibrio vulnificus]HAT8553884.1 ATP-binding cassette domain-containing protein [Vibrio vulnificus]HDY7484270.1 ATP-binding cassette domain-containing protein [Vibrio vulnificus]HDY7993034.1 ATP-binding cassette domain-containing protein [Vibrio vulnificus]
MNRINTTSRDETRCRQEMFNHLEAESLSALKQLDVNANIQLFARQWVNENGINSIDDIFALFDRLALPYRLVANRDDVGEHKLVLLVVGENELVLGHLESKQFTASDENADVIDTPQFFIVLDGPPLEKASPDWIGERLEAFRPIIPKLLLVSFITNLFALAIPFITMSIYDHVIGGDAGHELQGIAIGAGLLFVMMGWLRTLRSRVFASVSNRVSREISQSLVQRLLRNSYAQNQQTASSSQQNQVMLSERISGVLSGPLGNALFDLPFIAIFVLAIGVLGGWLVLVPIVSLILYYVLAKRSIRSSGKRSMQSTVAGTNRQNMTNELASKLAFIRSAGFSEYWIQRFQKANLLASKATFNQSVLQSRYTSAYYFIGLSSTLAVMGLGIGLIFEQIMTPGGLIASMMLISKVTGPAQVLANSALRFNSFSQSKLQVNRILSQPSEREFSYQHHPLPKIAPNLTLTQVTLRYPKQSRPALNGVSFDIASGEVVAITGPSGSGKSTLIEVLSGLQPIQNGMVELEGVNLAQYDPQLYRHWCFIRAAYPDLLTLSIREWLSDGHKVEEQKMLSAIEMVGGHRWFSTLPDGLDTSISSIQPDSLFDMLSGTVAQILIDAKALVYDYPMYLMDNPVPDGHPNAKRVFNEFLSLKKGKATVIFTSHDPDLIKLADKVVVLDEGSLVYAGPLEREPSSGLQSSPEQSLSQQPLSQELSQSKQGVANG